MPTWKCSGGTTFDGRSVVGTDELAEDLRIDVALLTYCGRVCVQILAPQSENLDLENPSIIDVWIRGKAARRGQTVQCDTKVEPLVVHQGSDPDVIY